jgi:Tol biopolymer transport system component
MNKTTAIILLLGQCATPLAAQTSRIDALTYASPSQLGLQGAAASITEPCCQPRISDDGRYVVFLSLAKNLVAGDHNNNIDVFLRDRQLGTTQRINVRSDGTQGRSGDAVSNVQAAVSADGDLVVFSSRQFDLVADDTNLASDVFLHRVSTGVTTRVMGIGGAQPDDASSAPSVSGDGRFVVFESSATNFATNHVPGQHIYLLDRDSGTIERISARPDGVAASGGGSSNPTVSDDGRFVAFLSSATDLVAAPGNGNEQLYVRDRQLGVTTRLSQLAGNAANAPIRNGQIAGNGSRVVFDTIATNLDVGDSNGVEDVYAVSIPAGIITRVSVDGTGAQTSGRSQRPSISRDGQHVAFESVGVLAPGGVNGSEQVYLRDLGSQSNVLASGSGNGSEVRPSLAGNGQVVAFISDSTDLVSGDSNVVFDDFVRDLPGGSTERVSLADASGPFPSQANGSSSSSQRGQRQLSADGRFLVTETAAKNLGTLDTGTTSRQIVRIDRNSNQATLVSIDLNGNPAQSAAFDPAMSSDGRFVVFRSATTNLVPGDSNGTFDIFWRDSQGGPTERINLGPGGIQGLGGATTTFPTVSDDGQLIAFVSNQNNLVPNDTNAVLDIFVRDRVAAVTSRVSVDSNGLQANGLSDFPVLSADGRFVVFSSLASNLVVGDIGGFQDIFRHDRQTGQTVLISQSDAGAQGNNNSFVSAISADGNFIAFSSAATNLVAGDSNARTDIFVRDVSAGTTTLVSRDSTGVLSNGTCSVPSISADGRYVGFLSLANNLVAGDTNLSADYFRHDRQTGQTLRLSVDPDGRQARAPLSAITAGQLSPDGSVGAIETNAQDWQLTIGVSGSTGLLLATPELPPTPDPIFGNGFEPMVTVR